MSWSAESTKAGHLPPWEVAKAFAFCEALAAMEAHLGQPAYELLGQRSGEWIAGRLELKGGGAPSGRAVQKVIEEADRAANASQSARRAASDVSETRDGGACF